MKQKKRKYRVVFACGFCKGSLSMKHWKGDTWKGYFICDKCMKVINQARATGKVRKSKRAAMLIRKGILRKVRGGRKQRGW